MRANPILAAVRALRRAGAPIRAHDWWEFKLAPALALFYGALLSVRAPLLPALPQALLLLAALAAASAFVSVLNDVTDLGVDAAAGKPNRMADRSTAARAAFLLVPLAAGLAVAAAWRRDPPLACAYLGAFAAFLLYSLPPVRLKGRGAAGAAADAAGAHLFPALTALLLGLRAAAAPADPLLLAAAALWSFALGLRGILWHQLGDLEADRQASVRTLPGRHGPAAMRRFGETILLPIELAAFALLLARMDAALAGLFLALHAVLLVLRRQRDGVAPAVVQPRPGATIMLHDYYAAWLPAAIVLQSSLRHPADLTLLLVQAALFPGRTRQVAGELWRLRPGAPHGATA